MALTSFLSIGCMNGFAGHRELPGPAVDAESFPPPMAERFGMLERSGFISLALADLSAGVEMMVDHGSLVRIAWMLQAPQGIVAGTLAAVLNDVSVGIA